MGGKERRRGRKELKRRKGTCIKSGFFFVFPLSPRRVANLLLLPCLAERPRGGSTQKIKKKKFWGLYQQSAGESIAALFLRLSASNFLTLKKDSRAG